MLAGRCTIGVGGGGGNSLNCMVQEGSRGAWSKWPRLTAARTATRLKRPARLHGAALWKTPRRVGAEQRPLRCLPAVADSHRLCPCRRDRAWSALRSSSTGHAGALLLPRRHHHHARQEHRTRPWCGWRAGRRPCGSMVKVPPPPRQCPSPAPVPPQGAPGSCGWRGAPGSGRHTGRPTTASGARASHLQSRPLPRLGTTQCQLRRLAPTLTLTLTLALAPTLTLTLTPNPNPGPDPDTDPDH